MRDEFGMEIFSVFSVLSVAKVIEFVI